MADVVERLDGFARSFQPVCHFQAADVQRAQPEALDERLHARFGLRVVASPISAAEGRLYRC